MPIDILRFVELGSWLLHYNSPSVGTTSAPLMKFCLGIQKVFQMKKLNWSLSPQATANFGLVLVVLTFNCVVIHRNTIALHQAQNASMRTSEVFGKSRELVTSLSDTESAVRGYVMTEDQRMLAIYHRLSTAIPALIENLRALVKDDPGQIKRLDELVNRVDQRLTHLQAIVTLRDTRGFDAAREQVLIDAGATIDGIRQLVDEFQLHENELLNARTREQRYRFFVVLAANLAAAVIGVAITIAAWYLVERELEKRRAAEANAQSERQNLLVTLTSIGDGVIVTDAQCRVKLANPIAMELMGNPDRVIGRSFSEIFSIIDENSRKTIPNPITQMLTQGINAVISEQAVLQRADHREIPIEQTAAPIRDVSGAITGAVFVFRDCTSRRTIEREMSERERRFRRVFESPLMGIGIGTAQGNLLEANDVYLDLIGCRREQINFASLSWDGKPQGQSPLDENTQRELEEKGACRPFERTYTRTDGTRVPVLISAARLMDDQNRIVIFVVDLSQSKRAEAALRESEARFRVLSECMPQKVWTAGRDGQFEYLNNMFLEYTGLPAERMAGWSWTNVVHPDDLKLHLNAWNESLSTGNMLEIEHRVRKHTGEFRWHLARALPVYKPDGEIAMWVGTNTDIHDQKQSEAMLREEHHRKDQFLALLAHELRNPLAPLSNAIQVFPSVQNDPAHCTTLLGIMQRQVRQMTRLIDDLLDLARITTGRMRLRRERIVVENVVSAAVEAVQPLVCERQHKLTVRLPEEELWLDADSARLAQILINLLHNAAKYTDSKGQLSLDVERSGTDVLFRVRDNGAGIAREMLVKIFDLFMQIDLTLDRAQGGLGIGLTLVRTLVELHDGSVTASSDGIGKGSEFIVRLPLLNVTALPPSSTNGEHRTQLMPSTLPVLHILVVDDVQASAKTFALMLQTLGQVVEVAFDGPTAISLAKEKQFDLVFLDIAMPGMDGLEVARRLRSIPEFGGTMLVALTGFGQEEDRVHSLHAGFNDHLTKPTSLDLLKEVLLRAAHERAAHSANNPASLTDD